MTHRYKILGPNDTQEAKEYLGKWVWFRSTYEKAANLPHDPKFAAKLFDIREGLPNPYYGEATTNGSPNGIAFNDGLAYIVVLEQKYSYEKSGEGPVNLTAPEGLVK